MCSLNLRLERGRGYRLEIRVVLRVIANDMPRFMHTFQKVTMLGSPYAFAIDEKRSGGVVRGQHVENPRRIVQMRTIVERDGHTLIESALIGKDNAGTIGVIGLSRRIFLEYLIAESRLVIGRFRGIVFRIGGRTSNSQGKSKKQGGNPTHDVLHGLSPHRAGHQRAVPRL